MVAVAAVVLGLIFPHQGLPLPLVGVVLALFLVFAVPVVHGIRVDAATGIARAPLPEPGGALEDAPRLTETRLRLRCGACGTEFDVADSDARPLRHSCPGCGVAGVLHATDLTVVGRRGSTGGA